MLQDRGWTNSEISPQNRYRLGSVEFDGLLNKSTRLTEKGVFPQLLLASGQ